MNKNVIKISTTAAVFTGLVGLSIIKKALKINSRAKAFKSIKNAKAIKIDINIKEVL